MPAGPEGGAVVPTRRVTGMASPGDQQKVFNGLRRTGMFFVTHVSLYGKTKREGVHTTALFAPLWGFVAASPAVCVYCRAEEKGFSFFSHNVFGYFFFS